MLALDDGLAAGQIHLHVLHTLPTADGPLHIGFAVVAGHTFNRIVGGMGFVGLMGVMSMMG